MESSGGILWASNGHACCTKLRKYTTRFLYEVKPYLEGKITTNFPFPCHTSGGRSWFVVNHVVKILTAEPR